jgi:TonB-linked SusC/RagA family outer membrane protein
MKHKLLSVFAFLFVATMFSYGQRTISGVVTSAKDKQPLIGATVIVEKTTIGTTTDIDGKYSLSVPNEAKNLVVSYTGMQSQTVVITGTSLDVALADNEKILNDVVVTALGIKREKKALGYAVQEVNADDLTKGGNPDALSALSGKVAGLSVTTASGQPGAAVNLQLRGITSISNDNQPLIVVDGVPIDNSQYNTLSNVGSDPGGNNGGINQNRGVDLNPDDIENVSVLKGPSAAALYGSLASNGVIMITTKKGSKKGSKKWSVDIGSSVTFDKVNKLPALQNTYLQGSGNTYSNGVSKSWGPNKDTMYWDGLGAASNNGYDVHGNIVGKSDPTAKIPFTPYDNTKFFQTGVTTNNNVSLTGGSDNGSFRLGVSNLYQTGIIPLTDINKTTVTLSGEQKLGKSATISGSATYINSGMDGALSGNNGSAITYGVYRTPINFDNTNGITNSVTNPNIYTNLDGTNRTYFAGGFDNPYFSINNNTYRSDLNRAFGAINATVDATSWLNLGARMGADFYSERHQQVLALGSYTNPAGQIIVDQYFSRIINADFMGTLHRQLFRDFNASLLLGYNVYSNYGQNAVENGTNLNFPGFNNISDASTIIASESHSNILRYAAYGALNLDWKSQIYFNLTDRNEWSSTLPQGGRSYNYPSVSAAWIFTETAKLSNSKWFPFGKVRLSWAEVGKSPSPYLLNKYYGQYTVGNDGWTTGVSFPFNGLNGYSNNGTLNNAAIKPEFTKSYEAGLEMRFLTGLKTFGGFGLDATYYNTTTVDGIIPAPIAPSTGFQNFISNNGQIRNQGVEIVGTITPVKVSGFKWDIAVNWSKNISKVLSLGAGLNQYAIGGFTSVESEAIVGQPYGVIYGGDYLRNSQRQVVVDGRQTVGGVSNPNYGLPIADPNQKIIGNPNPKWNMGFRNTFSYKGLSLSLLFDIKHGGDIYDGTEGALVTYGRAASTATDRQNTAYNAGGVIGIPQANGTTTITNTPNNINVNMTAIDPSSGKSIAQLWYTGNGGGFGSVSTPFIEDGSYFRLRELSLSYSIPSKVFTKVFIKGIDVSFLARNLFLVTKYKGVDPDQSAAGAGNLTGLEWFNLPSTKSYGFSVKLHF